MCGGQATALAMRAALSKEAALGPMPKVSLSTSKGHEQRRRFTVPEAHRIVKARPRPSNVLKALCRDLCTVT